jgi:hypothetical protein
MKTISVPGSESTSGPPRFRRAPGLSNHGISRIFIVFFLPDFTNRPKKTNYLLLLIFFDFFRGNPMKKSTVFLNL